MIFPDVVGKGTTIEQTINTHTHTHTQMNEQTQHGRRTPGAEEEAPVAEDGRSQAAGITLWPPQAQAGDPHGRHAMA